MSSMHDFIRQHNWEVAGILAVVGACVGLLLKHWSRALCQLLRDTEATTTPVKIGAYGWIELTTAALFASYFLAVFQFQAHACHEVRPDLVWMYGRAIGHLVLIALLVAATATDLCDFIIPDQITMPGLCLGLLLAVGSGDTQLMHLWVDWNHPLVEIYGPWIPDWIKAHPHWHGLGWSVAGVVAGGGITWACRVMSSLVLQQESLGFGDVTLMAMIGAFLGWQPIVFVFLLAPLCAIAIGISVRLLTNRPYLPYGPYLSLAAVLVMLFWQPLWQLEIPGVISIRRLFGDAIGLGILVGIAVTAFVFLLGIVRLYRLIPGKERATAG